ncbi:MAG TPA: hypothetical protein VGZ22_17940 [Isosphaeraceae bacterium]|jgi:hypothetical protein|nr:hypothetical protein [Isosphaeraceae bacterium]
MEATYRASLAIAICVFWSHIGARSVLAKEEPSAALLKETDASARQRARFVSLLMDGAMQATVNRERPASSAAPPAWTLVQRFQHLVDTLLLANRLEANNPTKAEQIRGNADFRFLALYRAINMRLARLAGIQASLEEQIRSLQMIQPTSPHEARWIARHIQLLSAQLRAVVAREGALTRLLHQATPDRPGG